MSRVTTDALSHQCNRVQLFFWGDPAKAGSLFEKMIIEGRRDLVWLGRSTMVSPIHIGVACFDCTNFGVASFLIGAPPKHLQECWGIFDAKENQYIGEKSIGEGLFSNNIFSTTWQHTTRSRNVLAFSTVAGQLRKFMKNQLVLLNWLFWLGCSEWKKWKTTRINCALLILPGVCMLASFETPGIGGRSDQNQSICFKRMVKTHSFWSVYQSLPIHRDLLQKISQINGLYWMFPKFRVSQIIPKKLDQIETSWNILKPRAEAVKTMTGSSSIPNFRRCSGMSFQDFVAMGKLKRGDPPGDPPTRDPFLDPTIVPSKPSVFGFPRVVDGGYTKYHQISPNITIICDPLIIDYSDITDYSVIIICDPLIMGYHQISVIESPDFFGGFWRSLEDVLGILTARKTSRKKELHLTQRPLMRRRCCFISDTFVFPDEIKETKRLKLEGVWKFWILQHVWKPLVVFPPKKAVLELWSPQAAGMAASQEEVALWAGQTERMKNDRNVWGFP